MFFNGTSFALGFATGLGTGAFAREAAHGAGLALRPVVKAVLKGAITTAEKARESMAVVGETFEDLVVEARSEMATTKTAEAADVAAPAEEAERMAATGTEGGNGSRAERKKSKRERARDAEAGVSESGLVEGEPSAGAGGP